MEEVGVRLRARARALGLSDAEVARRAGLGLSRYANYVSGVREPDFATFLRICQALQTTPSAVLGVGDGDVVMPDANSLRRRIGAAVETMDVLTLQVAAEVVEALARRSVSGRKE